MTKRNRKGPQAGSAPDHLLQINRLAGVATDSTTRTPASTTAATPRRKTLGHVLLLIVVSAAAYGLTLRNGFVTDDNTQILMNPNVKESPNVGKIFSGDVWAFSSEKSAIEGVTNYYRPLQILVYAEEYAVFGARPWGWHAVNLVLNAGVVVAVYILIAMLGGAELALWSSLLFALHPMHSEAVAWIAALPELQCGLLIVVAMIFYHRARSGGNLVWNIALSTAAFLGALFSKEMALLFPAILLSYEYFYRGEPLKKLWRSLRWIWPYLVALQIYIIARVLALGAFAPVYQAARAPLGPLQLALAIPTILARYVGKLLAPIEMNYFYAFPMPRTFGGWTIAGFAVMTILVAGMFALRNDQPLLAFSVAWFLLTLAPAMSLNRIGENFFTERYLYIPSLGFCVVAAWGWLRLRTKSVREPGHLAVWGAGAAVMVFYAAQVERRIPVFHDNFTLLSDTIRKSPGSGEAHAELAAAFFARGDSGRAIEHMTRSLELRPHHEISLLKLAQYFVEEKRYDEAINCLQEAVALHPEYDVAWINLAKTYTEKGAWELAAATYRHLEQVDPKHASYYERLAGMADANGHVGEDIAEKQEEAKREPHNPATLVQLGDVYARAGRWGEAEVALKRAIGEDPKNVPILMKLGICLEQTGDRQGALDSFERALALRPDFALARKYLGEALAAAGRIDESTAQFQAILANNPRYEHADEVHYALGLNLEKKGDVAGAVREHEQALVANPNFVDAQKRLQSLGRRNR